MMIQNMILEQQMMQQQMMFQQMEEQQRIEQQNINLLNRHKVKVFFEGSFGKINIIVESDIIISESSKKLRNRIGQEKFNQKNIF